MAEGMSGQWIARFPGPPPGLGVLDLDHRGHHFSGEVRILQDHLPMFRASIDTPHLADAQSLQVVLQGLDQNGAVITPAQLRERHPETQFGETATVDLKLNGDKLTVAWKTNTGAAGELVAQRNSPNEPSEYKPSPDVNTWLKFQEACWKIGDRSRYIFRGQPSASRLRTAFHRAGRFDLSRYVREDIPALHAALVGRTRHLFDMGKPEEYGAFLNLVQHHGYPTPLLDWTESPFVAAYFAFRHVRQPHEGNGPVRIFMFDSAQWRQDFRQMTTLANVGPHFSLLRALAIENPRVGPQQALSTASNIDDIESYIKYMEHEARHEYLTVYDLPYSDRTMALDGLEWMGVTAATLFPGLDGACEDLRSRHFGRG